MTFAPLESGPSTRECYRAFTRHNATVGILDLLTLLANWGDCPTPGSEVPPKTVQECLDRYLNYPEKLEACLLMLELQTAN